MTLMFSLPIMDNDYKDYFNRILTNKTLFLNI
ncbi:hypothetical protein SAMN05421786_101113 [Chryseobacterium ureilyticum]|uniref:Uncharacterized protein n=1 Tax=Chryseobacterium ureilyticum TaxID=373668 RepID=A0A1N7JXJ7_9FLAO|nr:hypothetical protein SAMN05421786_101113 [Chryseobacterium ureilyticum]